MIIGFVGLGKMGRNMALNLVSKNIKVVGYNKNPEKTKELIKKGIGPSFSLKELVFQLPSNKKIIWLMVPNYSVDEVLNELKIYLSKGDTVIDGGNSNYKDSIRRARDLRDKGVSFLDVGTCGGVEEALNGVSLTIGGDKKAYEELRLLFSSLSLKDNYGYVGPSGSGHFAKMIHNMIEYGMMQAIGEGFESLKHSGFEYDMAQIAGIWSKGSVISSHLMSLSERIFSKNKDLSDVDSFINDSGEGKWAIEHALEKNVPVPTSAIALMARYRSRDQDMIAEKVISSLRREFGGHGIKTIERKPEERVIENKNINKKKKSKVAINKKIKKKKIVKKKKR